MLSRSGTEKSPDTARTHCCPKVRLLNQSSHRYTSMQFNQRVPTCVAVLSNSTKHKAAEQEERAIEIGKSISQIRRRLTNTAKESEAKVLDEKSLDFADDETKKAYQDALKLERAAAKRVAEIAEAARTKQMERKRAAQTEACVAMEEDTKMPCLKGAG